MTLPALKSYKLQTTNTLDYFTEKKVLRQLQVTNTKAYFTEINVVS